MLDKIQTKAPGKLMLTGEWSILKPGNSCISLAVDRYVYVSGSIADNWQLTSSLITNSILFSWSYTNGLQIESPITHSIQNLMTFSLHAITITFKFLTEINHPIPKPHSITINSDEFQNPQTQQKLGLGSSAASTVALINFLLLAANYQSINSQLLFKLAYLTHYQAQNNCGSGFDIATASMSKSIIYTSPNIAALLKNHTKNQPLAALIEQPWQHLKIEPFHIPESLYIAAAHSNVYAHTPTLINSLQHFALNNKEQYDFFIMALETCTKKIIQALKEKNNELVIDLITINRQLLIALGTEADIVFEPSGLKQILLTAEACGATGKMSGAGGGDYAITLTTSKKTYNTTLESWRYFNYSSLINFI